MSPIIVTNAGGGDFTPHPEGQFAARCIDVVDMGWQRTDFGPKYKIRVAFFCGRTERREIDGEKVDVPMTVMGFFTASLNEKANLRKFLESWRGRPFTIAEAARFDMEKMLNAEALIQVAHNKATNGKTYANITSIMRLPPGMGAPVTPPDYVRVCDRPEWTGPAPHPDTVPDHEQEPAQTYTGPNHNDDDDLPF
jgi:hypothetical protein